MDVQTVWQCGYYNTSVSRDGGRTWQTTAEEVSGLSCLVSFVDAETGWFTSEAQFKATADGGATWEELDLPEGVYKVAAISLRTPKDGYLLDDNGFLYTTQDGGETWSSQRLEFTKGTYILGTENSQAAMRFFDADHGLVVLSILGKEKTGMWALRTADGGQTWKEEKLPVESGMPYLSRDGAFLGVYTPDGREITLLRYVIE